MPLLPCAVSYTAPIGEREGVVELARVLVKRAARLVRASPRSASTMACAYGLHGRQLDLALGAQQLVLARPAGFRPPLGREEEGPRAAVRARLVAKLAALVDCTVVRSNPGLMMSSLQRALLRCRRRSRTRGRCRRWCGRLGSRSRWLPWQGCVVGASPAALAHDWSELGMSGVRRRLRGSVESRGLRVAQLTTTPCLQVHDGTGYGVPVARAGPLWRATYTGRTGG